MRLIPVLGAIYGGIHLLAWYDLFPNERELKLWRGAALLIFVPSAGALVLMGLIAAIVWGFSRLRALATRHTMSEQPPGSSRSLSGCTEKGGYATILNLGKGILCLLILAVGFLYPFARGYLIWECLRTVFNLPPGAFQTTQWPQYFPHIT